MKKKQERVYPIPTSFALQVQAPSSKLQAQAFLQPPLQAPSPSSPQAPSPSSPQALQNLLNLLKLQTLTLSHANDMK